MALKYQRLIHFIHSVLKQLPAGKQISGHCIEFKRLQNGDGTFSINAMVDDKRIHRVLGKVSEGNNRKHAEIYIEKGKYPLTACKPVNK